MSNATSFTTDERRARHFFDEWRSTMHGESLTKEDGSPNPGQRGHVAHPDLVEVFVRLHPEWEPFKGALLSCPTFRIVVVVQSQFEAECRRAHKKPVYAD
jgi:hypothetical protein